MEHARLFNDDDDDDLIFSRIELHIALTARLSFHQHRQLASTPRLLSCSVRRSGSAYFSNRLLLSPGRLFLVHHSPPSSARYCDVLVSPLGLSGADLQSCSSLHWRHTFRRCVSTRQPSIPTLSTITRAPRCPILAPATLEAPRDKRPALPTRPDSSFSFSPSRSLIVILVLCSPFSLFILSTLHCVLATCRKLGWIQVADRLPYPSSSSLCSCPSS